MAAKPLSVLRPIPNVMKKVTIRVTAEDIRNGKPGSSNDCPVALALLRKFPQGANVGYNKVGVIESGRPFYGSTCARVRKFIYWFDAEADVAKRRRMRGFSFTVRVP